MCRPVAVHEAYGLLVPRGYFAGRNSSARGPPPHRRDARTAALGGFILLSDELNPCAKEEQTRPPAPPSLLGIGIPCDFGGVLTFGGASIGEGGSDAINIIGPSWLALTLGLGVLRMLRIELKHDLDSTLLVSRICRRLFRLWLPGTLLGERRHPPVLAGVLPF